VDEHTVAIAIIEHRSTKTELGAWIARRYSDDSVSLTEAEGPLPLGPANDMIWFARGRVAVGVPRTAAGGVDETVRQLTARYERVGEKLAFAIIIKDDTERPGDSMDEQVQRAFDEIAPMVVCSAVAIVSSGFLASFFISLTARAFSLSRRGSSRQRIHSSLESAAAWMHQHLDDPDTSVEDILDTLRWAEANAV